MPDYNRHAPRGYCGDISRGAALGRPSVREESPEYAGRLYVRRIPINSGGYDRTGRTYFGVGHRVYWIANNEGTIDYCVSAPSRGHAVEDALRRFPQARVHNKKGHTNASRKA